MIQKAIAYLVLKWKTLGVLAVLFFLLKGIAWLIAAYLIIK